MKLFSNEYKSNFVIFLLEVVEQAWAPENVNKEQ